MRSVTLEEAQTHLSDLISHLQPGETVEIVSGQKIIARIVAAPYLEALKETSSDCPPRHPGSAVGTLTILSDDEAHLEHFQDYMP
jgi:antitoxin (DNA-binding transcriptional repressor) of toxin-antitoxin stability system